MLTDHQRQVASLIASDLIKEGMIWGEELEWYIKINTENFQFRFTSEEHYLAFEDFVLEKVEKRKKYVVVNDINTGDIYKFDNISRCAKYFNTTYDNVRGAIFNQGLMRKRYKIRYESKTIKELSKIS